MRPLTLALCLLAAPLAAQPAVPDSSVAEVEEAAAARFESEIARIEGEARQLRERIAAQDQQIGAIAEAQERIGLLEAQIALTDRRERAERERFFDVARVKYQRGYSVLRDVEANARALRGQALVTDFFGTVLELTDPTTYAGFDAAFADIRDELRDNDARSWFDGLVQRVGLPREVSAVGRLVPQIDGASRALETVRSIASGLFGRSGRRVEDLQRLERVECTFHAIEQLHADLRTLDAANAMLLPRFDALLAEVSDARAGYFSSLAGRPVPPPTPDAFYGAVRDTFAVAVDQGGAESLALYDRVERALTGAETVMLDYHLSVRSYLDYWKQMRAALVARRADPCVADQPEVQQRYALALSKIDRITRTVEADYLFSSTAPEDVHHEYYRLVTARYAALLGSRRP